MSGQATSLEELHKTLGIPQKIIDAHVEQMKQRGGAPIQMPQVVKKATVVQPAQQNKPVQPTITTPTVVPPKKGGCGCWGNK